MASQLETDLIALFTPANFTATKEDAATGWTGAIESLYDGKSGGSTITGGTASGDDLTLVSTSHGTKGDVNIGTAKVDSAGKLTVSGAVEATGSTLTHGIEVHGTSTLGEAGQGYSVAARSSLNGNYGQLTLRRDASNTTETKIASILLNGDDSSNANLKAHWNVVLNTAANPTTSSTSASTTHLSIRGPGCFAINTAPDPSFGFVTYCDLASGWAARFQNDGDNVNRYGILVSAGKDDGADGTYYFYCVDGDGHGVGYIEHNAGAFRLVDISDERSKKDIAPTMVRGIETLQGINPIEFRRVRQGEDARLVACGLSAQNLQAVYPEAVSIGKDGMLGVAKDSLIPVLIQAVKEQQQQIEGLKQQVEQLLSAKVDK